MTTGARKPRHIAVATTAEIVATAGMRGDLVTAGDGGVGIIGQGTAKVIGDSTPERAYQVRALISSLSSPAFTLSGDGNTLTAGANGALGTYLGLSYAMPAGSATFVLVGGPADGLWTVAVEGNGSTPAVLTRTLAYRTAAALPEMVGLYAGDIIVAGQVPLYALVGTPVTPGSGALPYYRTDAASYNQVNALRATYIAALASLPANAGMMAQIFSADIPDASNDWPLVIPYNVNLLRAWIILDTVGATNSTATLRSATGGGGNGVCGTIPTEVRGYNQEAALDAQYAFTARNRLLAAGTYYVRGSVTTIRGRFYAETVRA